MRLNRGNTTTIGTKSVRENGVSWNSWEPIQGPLKSLKLHNIMVLRGLKGALNWGPHYTEKREPLGLP